MTTPQIQSSSASIPASSLPGLLERHFGFREFRPGQQRVIEALLSTNAALAVFPTGGGKSLCYQLPALLLDGLTLVVSPLIALMKDQIDFLRSKGIAAARMDSSLSADEARSVAASMRDGSLKMLYVAPERFNNERFIETLKQSRIALFAVDEAHCISEWGHNFRPDYLKLAQMARQLQAQRVLALTATATPAVVSDICKGFGIEPSCAVVTGFYRPNLQMCVSTLPAEDRDQHLLHHLKNRKAGPAIVYVTLQRTAERVAAMLEQAGLPAKAYHAGMEDDQRTAVQEWWKASDCNIVVATIAFGMGIDKANVRYVYHYNLPKSLESYSQEIGRAGRDDLPSVVHMLICTEDVPVLENFAYGDTPTDAAVRGVVAEVLGAGKEFDLDLYDLSSRHDIRLLVLRTALTYLELLGVLRQGTPIYAGYRFKPLLPLEQIVGKFDGERSRFLADVFSLAHKGKTWYTLDAGETARQLKQDRLRLVRALEYLAQQGWIELEASDVRYRYTLLHEVRDIEPLVSKIIARFQRREQQEVRRIEDVLRLVTHDGCQVNSLVGYFGEKRDQPCGHCMYCTTGKAQVLSPTHKQLPLPADLDTAAFESLRQEHPKALAEPRQAARFLCGLSSPATVKARLTRDSLFGVFEDYRFADVLAWYQRQG